MSKLADIKKRLAEVDPLVVHRFSGIANCLVVDDKQLHISATPPSISFIMETQSITTLILRYSETFKKSQRQIKEKSVKNTSALAQKVVKELTDSLTSSPEEQAKQVGTLTRLGKEYLISKSISGWWNEDEKFKIFFTPDKQEADDFNEKSDDTEMAIWIDRLSDMELFSVSMELIKALAQDGDIVPNIPMEVVQTNVNEEGVATNELVIETVPANELSRFPRSTRNIAVADIRESASDTVGDSESMSATRN